MFAFSCSRPHAAGFAGLVRQIRQASSKRWQARQQRDQFTREAAVQGLKSRAAFKLLQIDDKYRLFRRGQTVVDLGYAPGSWSQVAVNRTQPNGRVLGVDIIPAQPPKGVSTIQGNFLSPEIQEYIEEFLRNPNRGRPRQLDNIDNDSTSSLLEANETQSEAEDESESPDTRQWRTVDVVLSDMSAPWYQTSGFWKRSLSNPYHRMMNTSGNNFRDHAGSMDLCNAALQFSSKVLKAGGHFVCKFYQGAEDKDLEKQLKEMFQKVHRLKPESSRSARKGI
ncbi:Uncharacterized protein PECH_003038 [Penicillium ucsense]|uniref:rRNA methyltransferase 2, mitochondrial n=1 Tax=Penicillium ucsense TaxID=2839758 RepID=A0A8J8WC62_9EURO|nr:Uncharacterized protein PECM_008122 [Penicillium ucsense]KAF7730024.1 Uncharacterized protein PECH_003038 [Penicillium ucsense]